MDKVKSVCLLLIVVLSSCAKDENASVAPIRGTGNTTAAANNRPPEVVSASILPPQPTSATTLYVDHAGRDSEGDSIQYTFRWYVDDELVQEGPSGQLAPGKHKKGSHVYVEIIPSDSYSRGNAFRTEAITIGNLLPAVTSVSLRPDQPKVGDVITALVEGSDPDGDEVGYTYEWRVNADLDKEPQEDSKFSTKGLKKKDMVYVIVRPHDREGAGPLKASDVVVLVNSAPQITSTPPYALKDGTYTYQVTAKDPDGDKLTYRLLELPPGMTIDPSTGLVRWQVPTQITGKQEVPIKISADDGDGGSATQEFSLTLEQR